MGPATGAQWSGALFGQNQAEIKAHGVGTRGRIPEKCVLEYPIKGVKLEAGEDTYTAWGIKNMLTEQDSYYIKVEGTVRSILFGELPEGDQADLHILKI